MFRISRLKVPFTLSKAKLQKDGNYFPHPFNCQRHFINEKNWKLKKLRPPSIQLLKMI